MAVRYVAASLNGKVYFRASATMEYTGIYANKHSGVTFTQGAKCDAAVVVLTKPQYNALVEAKQGRTPSSAPSDSWVTTDAAHLATGIRL